MTGIPYAEVFEPWRVNVAASDTDEKNRRKIVRELLRADGFTMRRVRGAIAQRGHQQVATNLGISLPWLRALLREPAPKPIPRPRREPFDPMRINIPFYKSTLSHPWIPIYTEGI